jgi:hypothetical protein
VIQQIREEQVGAHCQKKLVGYFTEKCDKCSGVETSKSPCHDGHITEVMYERRLVKGHCKRNFIREQKVKCSRHDDCPEFVIKKGRCEYARQRIEQFKQIKINGQCIPSLVNSFVTSCSATKKAFCSGKGIIKSKCVNGYQMSYKFKRVYINGECIRQIHSNKRVYCQDDLNQAMCDEKRETKGSCTVFGRRFIHRSIFTKSRTGECVEKKTTFTRFDATCIEKCEGAYSQRVACHGKYRDIEHYRAVVKNGRCVKVAECIRQVPCKPCNDYIVLKGDCIASGKRIHYISKFLSIDGKCRPIHNEIVQYDTTCLDVCNGTATEKSPCKNGVKTAYTFRLSHRDGQCVKTPIDIVATPCDECEDRKEHDAGCAANGMRDVTITEGVKQHGGKCITFKKQTQRKSITCTKPCQGQHVKFFPCDGTRKMSHTIIYDLSTVNGLCVKTRVSKVDSSPCNDANTVCPADENIKGKCIRQTGTRRYAHLHYVKKANGHCEKQASIFVITDPTCPADNCHGEEERPTICVDGQRTITTLSRIRNSSGKCTFLVLHTRKAKCSPCGDSIITKRSCDENGKRGTEEIRYEQINDECVKMKEFRHKSSSTCKLPCTGSVQEKKRCDAAAGKRAVYKFSLSSVNEVCYKQLVSISFLPCKPSKPCDKSTLVKGSCSKRVFGYRVDTKMVYQRSENGTCVPHKYKFRQFDTRCVKKCKGKITKKGICVNGNHVEFIYELQRKSNGACEPVLVDQIKTPCNNCGKKIVIAGKCQTNRLLEEKVTEYKLINGRCEKIKRIQLRPSLLCRLPCDGNTTEAGPCDRKKEWKSVTIYNLRQVNGLCIAKEIETVLKPCLPRIQCAPKTTVKGNCISRKGARRVYEVQWAYKRNVCHQVMRKKQIFDDTCVKDCAGTELIRDDCKNNKQVVSKYVFSKNGNKCSKSLVSIDIVSCLEEEDTPPDNCRGSRVIPLNCNHYDRRKFIRITKVFQDGSCTNVKQHFTRFDKSCHVYCDGTVKKVEPCNSKRMRVNVFRWMRFEGKCRLVKTKTSIAPCKACSGRITMKGKCFAAGIRHYYLRKKVLSGNRCITKHYKKKVNDKSCSGPSPCGRHKQILTSKCKNGVRKVSEIQHVLRNNKCVRVVVPRKSVSCSDCIAYEKEPGACSKNGLRRYFIRVQKRSKGHCVNKFRTVDLFDDTCIKTCIGDYTEEMDCENGKKTVVYFSLETTEGKCNKKIKFIEEVQCDRCVGKYHIKGLCSVRGKREYHTITMNENKEGDCQALQKTTEVTEEECLSYCQGVHTERGKCLNGERKVTIHRYELRDGECVDSVTVEEHPCDYCYSMSFLRGGCNELGKRAYLKITHAINENGACMPSEELVHEDTDSCVKECDPHGIEKLPCDENDKRKVVEYTQQLIGGKCLRFTVNEKEESCEKPVAVSCVETSAEKRDCNKFGERLFIVTEKYLDGTECKERQSVFTKFDPTCFKRCEGTIYEKKGPCLKGRQVVKTIKFVSKRGQCRPVVIKLNKKKCTPCGGKWIARGPCKSTRQRIFYVTKYKMRKGWCVKKQKEEVKTSLTCSKSCKGVIVKNIKCTQPHQKQQIIQLWKLTRNSRGRCVRRLVVKHQIKCPLIANDDEDPPTYIPPAGHQCKRKKVKKTKCDAKMRRTLLTIKYVKVGNQCVRKLTRGVKQCGDPVDVSVDPSQHPPFYLPPPPYICRDRRVLTSNCNVRRRRRVILTVRYFRQGSRCVRNISKRIIYCGRTTKPADISTITGIGQPISPLLPTGVCKPKQIRKLRCSKTTKKRVILHITFIKSGSQCIRRIIKKVQRCKGLNDEEDDVTPDSSVDPPQYIPPSPFTCKPKKVLRGKCNRRRNGRRVVLVIRYKKEGSQCVRRVTRKVKKCGKRPTPRPTGPLHEITPNVNSHPPVVPADPQGKCRRKRVVK